MPSETIAIIISSCCLNGPQAHRKEQIARKKQRKRGSQGEVEVSLPNSGPSGSGQGSTCTSAGPASSAQPSSSAHSDATHASVEAAVLDSAQSADARLVTSDPPSPSCSTEAPLASAETAHAAAQQGAAEVPAASNEQTLCGGVADDGAGRGSDGAANVGSGAAQPASSRRSAQTRIPSEVTPLGSSQSETSTEVLPDSDGTPDEHADRELTSSAESPSLESRPPAYGEVPTTTSCTYTSRNAESLSLLAAQQTGFQGGGLAGSADSGGCGGGAEGVNLQEPEQASHGRMKKLSEQLCSASLAPDAKSGNRPAERAAGTGAPDVSVEATGNVLEDLEDQDKADSTCSGERQLPTIGAVNLGEEQIAESNPCSTELAGGTAPGKASKPAPPARVHINATTVVDILLEPSAVFRATGVAHDFAHDSPEYGSTAGLIAVPVLPTAEQQPRLSGSGLQPEAVPAAAKSHKPVREAVEDRGGRGEGGQPGESSAGESHTVSVPACEGAADVEQQLGVGLTSEEEAALYGDLDALQEDASGLGDLSDTEADVSDVKEEQLKSSGVGSSGQVRDSRRITSGCSYWTKVLFE